MRIGIDLSTSGAISITDKNLIIDVLKYPQPEYNKNTEKVIKAKINFLKNEPKSATKIKQLKAELKTLKRHAIRDYKSIYDFLLPYKNQIDSCILEEPIRQIGGFATSVDSIASNFTTLGVYTTILSILEIPYFLILPTQWHKQFDYNIVGKDNKEKRECIKRESIRICREKFINADEFIVIPRHKNEDDNIAESTILSLVEV